VSSWALENKTGKEESEDQRGRTEKWIRELNEVEELV
jgi:hypothetical protein